MKIWVDDIRTPPSGWLWCKTSAQAIDLFSDIIVQRAYYDKPDLFRVETVSLDHDLGGDDTTRPIVLWMIENDFWPVEVRVHSANPPGHDWLVSMIERYKNGSTAK